MCYNTLGEHLTAMPEDSEDCRECGADRFHRYFCTYGATNLLGEEVYKLNKGLHPSKWSDTAKKVMEYYKDD